MGAYISQSDIEDQFGEANVLQWSNTDSSSPSTVDSARITRAIANAEAAIEDRFRGGKYVVPISGTSGSTPAKVVEWAAILAGVWLYRGRGILDSGARVGDRLTQMEQRVFDEIDDYLAGSRDLPASLAHTGPTAPHVPG